MAGESLRLRRSMGVYATSTSTSGRLSLRRILAIETTGTGDALKQRRNSLVRLSGQHYVEQAVVWPETQATELQQLDARDTQRPSTAGAIIMILDPMPVAGGCMSCATIRSGCWRRRNGTTPTPIPIPFPAAGRILEVVGLPIGDTIRPVARC